MADTTRFEEMLVAARRVHLDASVLGLHLVGHPRYLPLTRALFRLMSEGAVAATTSSVTVYQVLVEVYRRGEPEKAATVERCVLALPGMTVIPVDPAIAHQAAEVRAQLGGATERAIQIATALGSKAAAYLTQHSSFRRVAGMSVESLDLHSGS